MKEYRVKLERTILIIERAWERVQAETPAEAKILAEDRMVGYTDKNWEAFDEIVQTAKVLEVEEIVHYVNAYDHNRQYGGPEEGGWWYDTGELLGSIRCANDEEVEAAKKTLQETYGPQFAGHRPIGSVLCEGVLQIVVEDEPGADYPAERPHYE